MSDSAWIMGPECKTIFIVKVYTMHDVEVRSILSEAGDIVAHLAFIELSPGLFFTHTHQRMEGRTIGLRTITHNRLQELEIGYRSR